MKTYNSLVAAVAILPLVYGDRVTLSFEDLDISNDDKCGSLDFSQNEKRYAGTVITGATVVNSVGTDACETPIGDIDLSDKLENNVLWGDTLVYFDYLTFQAGDHILGNLAFDLAVDWSHLADGELDDDDTKITVELQLLSLGDTQQYTVIEKFPTKNGTGPYSIEWKPDAGTYSAFSISVNLISGSLVYDFPKVALDNIAWDHFTEDKDGNIDYGSAKTTTTSVPETTTAGNATTRPPSSHTETSAPATTSAPSRSNTTTSTFVFPSPTRTTEVQSSTSTGLAYSSAPTLFGFAAVLAAGAAFL
ncbi:uncharacterized protein Triagg1_179 [Trichoderma aggressivum f. europaeum]|uniref:Uncharacterized protein n=1 Tax=Trichoderma aggressivum f. europaeum TaxID=173218 RepID=A0AAE1JF91_9HYPO|nr:hypothetical protein Triagg1_179 [Trichoderma aggressivum f. europaeum]